MGAKVLEPVFRAILNMSLTGSVVICVVLVIRLFLLGLPKIYSYLLWSVVLLRLLCPVAPTADFSLMGVLDPVVEVRTEGIAAVTLIPEGLPSPEAETPQSSQLQEVAPQEPDKMDSSEILSRIWAAGVAAMVLYSLWDWAKLRQKVASAVHERENIWLADHIRSPFVLGLFHPRIYLPSSMENQEQGYILLHERHHIRRWDPIWKVLGFAALSIHWFNPLAWLAFLLACRDMEMSCDESVLSQLGEGVRGEYSASLLNLAVGHTVVGGMPLAFGEGDTKKRILHVLSWKKPKGWMKAAGCLCCFLVITACGLNPDSSARPNTEKILQPDTLSQILHQQELPWYLSQEETMAGREQLRYTLRHRELRYGEDGQGGTLLMCGVLSKLHEGQPVLTMTFPAESNPGAAGDAEEIFAWEDVRQRIQFGAALYRMDGEALTEKLQEAGQETDLMGHPVYAAELPGGSCIVKVLPAPAQAYVNHASYTVTLYFTPDREIYDDLMEQSVEKMKTYRENPELFLQSAVTLGDTWAVTEGDDTVLTLTDQGKAEKAEDCWIGTPDEFQRLSEMKLLPCEEHPYDMEGRTVTLQNRDLTLTVWEAAPWFGILDTGNEALWLRSSEPDTDLWNLLSGWAEAALAEDR